MSKGRKSLSGINLREALRIAKELGCTMFVPNRTGELIVQDPAGMQRVRITVSRKDAPRALTTLLHRIQRLPQ